MLGPDGANRWLTGNIDDAQSILHTTDDVAVRFYPVGPKIRNPKNHGPDLVTPHMQG